MRDFAPYSTHESKNKASEYRLFGISHHSGSLNGGHYIAEAYNEESNSWFRCND